MSESSYIKCPKCKMVYHVKAVKCPACNITPEEATRLIAEQKEIAENKAQEKEDRSLGKMKYCTACGSTFRWPKTVVKGNIIIEIILWLMFLLPGLIYSIWRVSSRHKACPTCGSPTIIPATSPIAQQALGKN